MTGFAFCGSHCNLKNALMAAKRLADANIDLLPIFSFSVSNINTRFWNAEEFCKQAESICGKRGIYTRAEAEPLGPMRPLDHLIICPCTGNTLARLAAGICDTPVTMAEKPICEGTEGYFFAPQATMPLVRV